MIAHSPPVRATAHPNDRAGLARRLAALPEGGNAVGRGRSFSRARRTGHSGACIGGSACL